MRKTGSILFLPALCMVLGLYACGSGGGGGGSTPSSETSGAPPFGDPSLAMPGGLLPGEPETLAVGATSDYYSGDVIDDDEITVLEGGARLVRTKIEIAFDESAAVGDLNNLLKSIKGHVTSSLEGVNLLSVRIPDPGSTGALDQLISQAEEDPSVLYVTKSYMPQIDALPDGFAYNSSELDKIDHHLAVRAHAAWNAKAALSGPTATPPLLVIGDYFGGGMPQEEFNATADPLDYNTRNPDDHGYHVLGVIAAKHGNSENAAGMYPGNLSLRAVDGAAGMDLDTMEDLVVIYLRASNGNAVLNTSLGLTDFCRTGLQRNCMEPYARNWIKRVRGSAYPGSASEYPSIENRFIHVAAAGNFWRAGDSFEAPLNSPFNAASLLTDLKTENGTPLPPLTNTLVIEARTNTEEQPYSTGCLAYYSKFSGHLSAVGTDVWSFVDSRPVADNLSGTSMAAPQAAGLAAYVWALDPELSSQEVTSLLAATADAGYECQAGEDVPMPVIDAYEALLAVDKASALGAGSSPSVSAPARLAILDIVADDVDALEANGVFDETDLERFLKELHLYDPPRIDYSRFDLNGDGYTGGVEDKYKRKFNLDIDYPPTFEKVTASMDVGDVEFDENKASDMQVLCYYAYSSFYSGDEEQRTKLLEPYRGECEPIRIAFVSDRDGSSNIYTMNPDGSDQKHITQGFPTDAFPVWSPDGSKIAFSRRGVGVQPNIFVVNDDGSNPVSLTGGDFINFSELPSWSPDSTKLTFAGYGTFSGNGDVFVVNADGSDLVNLTNVDGPGASAPVWSPDGSKIAFLMNDAILTQESPQHEIYVQKIFVMNADGTGPTRLTGSQYLYESNPAWSPDSNHIVYMGECSDLSCSDEIFQIFIDDEQKTSGEGSSMYPKWSPDGKKISYIYYVPGTEWSEIHIIDIASGSDALLTSDYSDSNASWSPDSKEIVFQRSVEGGCDILKINLEDLQLTNLTENSGPSDYFPAWQP